MIRKSLATSVRATQDIWWRPLPSSAGTARHQQLLLPSAALHILDHHLHASGILPQTLEDATRIYDHDWLCASQAVTCYPHDGLMNKALEIDPNNNSAFRAHVWVTRVGNSSLQLGNMMTWRDTVLATACRAFVRKSRDGSSCPFRDDERRRFEQDGGAANATISHLRASNNNAASLNLPVLMERLPPVLPDFPTPAHEFW